MARPRLEVPPHGTRQRYQHRSDPCKTCGACREANARYIAERRAIREVFSGNQPYLYHDVPKHMVGCTHSLATIGQPCPWCGQIATSSAHVPGLVAA